MASWQRDLPAGSPGQSGAFASLRVVALFAIAAVAVGLSGCSFSFSAGGSPDIKEIEKKVETELSMRLAGSRAPATGSLNVPSVSVECPKDPKWEKGASFDCPTTVQTDTDGDPTTITDLQEQKGTVKITVKDDNKYRWEFTPSD